jgi:hypothetical protein
VEETISMTLPQQRARHAVPRRRRAASAAPEQACAALVDRLAGSDGHARPAALNELAELADEHPALRPAASAAVCALLRSPWRTGPDAADAQEPQLRRTAVQVLTDRLRDPSADTAWTGLDVDLAGAVLTGADFSGCWFTGGLVRLEGAWCIEGALSFAGARFTGARVSLRHWTSGQGRLDLSGARFTGGAVTLAGAVLDEGMLTCAGAVVDGGVLAFTEARLTGATLDLSGITVTAGTLSLADARLLAGRVLLVDARLIGGVTALRDLRLAPGVLSMAGACAVPGAVDVRGSEDLAALFPRA